MREPYDPVRTAALFKEAREMIAALDTEMRDLAREIRSALKEERSGAGRDLAAAQIMTGLPRNSPSFRDKPFWKFWR